MSAVKQELQPVATDDLGVQKSQAWVLLGAIRAADSIASALHSQTIRGLQQIRDQHLYRELNFSRFDDFLESEHSPMNYAKFNRLEKAIESEGDELFDFLQAIDAPLSKRKLLGKGDVRVEGKEIVAHIGDDEIRVPLNNTARILGVLSRVVEQRNEQSRRIQRGEKQVKSLKAKVEELKSGGGNHAAGQGGFFDAQLNVIGSFSMLAAEAEKLPEDQRKEHLKAVREMVSEQMRRIDEAFGIQVPEQVKKRAVKVPAHLLEEEEED